MNLIITSLKYLFNPLASPGEVVSVFTSPYLSAGAPALGEAKGLIIVGVIFNFKLNLFIKIKGLFLF